MGGSNTVGSGDTGGAPGASGSRSGVDRSDRLAEGLRVLGLAESTGVGALRAYCGELERWGSRLGLVHASGDDLVVRHILDSLAALDPVSRLLAGARDPVVADIGSGGGLPGVPLACFLPHVQFLLVERSGRKCGFLRGAIPASGIRNACVVQTELSNMQETATVVVFRAFRPLTPDLLRELLGRVRPRGALCAYKGKMERVRAELDDLGDTAAGAKIIPLSVPGLEEERHLVVWARGDRSELSQTL